MAPESIFLQAVSFHEAQKLLLEQVPDHYSVRARALAPPVCVLAAFTSELLLKCLICIEGGYPPRTHDLLALFKMLSNPTRKRLKEMWADHIRFYGAKADEFKKATGITFEPDVLLALAAGRKAFDLIRYQHEGRNEEYSFYLGALPDMLKRIAFELRPDWAKHAEKQWHEQQKLDD